MLTTACDSASQSRPSSSDPEPRTLGERLQAFAEEHDAVVGMAAGVARDGDVRRAAVGAERQGGEPVSASSIFQIASITKVFTGLLLAERVAAGKRAPDDPVGGLLPDSLTIPAPQGEAVTLGRLAAHASGLPRLPSNLEVGEDAPDPQDPYAAYEAADLFAAVDDPAFASTPGAQYLYSNYGYGLLGMALVRGGEAGYGDLVQTRIADPLGLPDTRLTLTDAQAARAVTGHTADGTPVPDWTFTNATAGLGGLYSTVDDMLRFLQAQADPSGPLKAAINTSHTRLHDAPDDRWDTTYGWHRLEREGRRYLWQNGGTFGVQTFAIVVPEENASVILLCNANLGEASSPFAQFAFSLVDAHIEGALPAE